MDAIPFKTYPEMETFNEGDPNSSYEMMLAFVEPSMRVLDLGCGPGSFARQLVARGCTVTGVDVNPEHALSARAYCADVRLADLENVALEELFPVERFDAAICADILEHLRNPNRLLGEIAKVLAPGGALLASIPNIAHGAVRLALLAGNFDYQPFGILDDTHVRFYTLKSAVALLEDAGYRIEAISRTTAPIFDPAAFLVPMVAREDFLDAAERVEADPESTTLQFVIKAKPAS